MKPSIVMALITSAILLAPCRLPAVTSLGSATITAIKARIFTPNGDGYNDKARFEIDNPEQLPLAGAIYDVSGSRVADMTPATLDPLGVLLWDGKDDSGQTVKGGIYLYELDFQGKKATGTVIVAR